MVKETVFVEHSKKILSISLPIGVDLTLLFATFFIDTFFLSLFSELPAASVGALFSLLGLIAMILRQIAQAGAVVTAQYIGKGERRSAQAAQFATLINGICVGIICTAFLWQASEVVPRVFGLDYRAAMLATSYLIIIAPGITLLSFKHTLSAIGLANKKTTPQMAGAIIGIIINIVLNWSVIYFGGADITEVQLVQGVALATVISYAANVFVLWHFVSNKHIFKKLPSRRDFREAIKRIWTTAIPTTVEPAAIQIQWIVLTMLVAGLGIEALAIRIYVLNFGMFVLTWSLSIAIAAQVLVSFEAGTKNYGEANIILLLSNIFASAGAAIAAFFMFLFSDSLIGFFTSDSDILRTARLLFLIAIPTEIAKAIYNTTCWSLVAWGDGKFAVGSSAIILFGLAIPAAWYLSDIMELGIVGIWLALALDEVIRAIIMVTRWNLLRRQDTKVSKRSRDFG